MAKNSSKTLAPRAEGDKARKQALDYTLQQIEKQFG